MAKLLKLRRGTTTQHGSFTGAEGEVTIDTTKDTAVVHDGAQAGGRPLAREDMNNVSSASIVGQITASALAGVKVQPNFGSQNIETTGTLASGDITISDGTPSITLNDTDHENDFKLENYNGTLLVHDLDANANRIEVASNGTVSVQGNLDVGSGVDVTGNITGTGNVDIVGQIEVGSVGTFLKDNQLKSNASGNMYIDHGTGNQDIVFRTSNSGPLDTTALTIKANGNVDIANGIDVTGDITVSGTVDGVDVAALKTAKDSLSTTNGALVNGVVATTQAQSDNSTKLSTTAYVRTAITNASPFPSGTKMLFQQTAAPTGWTKVTSGVDNKALRVVSGTAGSGGSNAFSNTLTSRSITANADNTTMTGNVSVANATQGGNVSVSIANASTGGTVNNHTLTTSQMPSHSHSGNSGNYGGGVYRYAISTYRDQGYSANTTNTGGGAAHNHGFTGGSHTHNANASFSGSAHTHNATFTANAHNHSINVTNLDLAVSYLDVIIASKD